LERTSSTQHVVTENANTTDDTSATPTTINELPVTSSQPGFDGFLQPPPYSEEDKYKKENPPPPYADVFTVELEHRGREEAITVIPPRIEFV